MEKISLSRRNWLIASSALLSSAATGALPPCASAQSAKTEPFRYCLNTGTLRGKQLSITEEIDIAAQAGYDAIEPWCDSIHTYVSNGGSLQDLRRRIEDKGLTVEGAIGFAQWIVDDDQERAKGLETMKRDMDVMVQIGAKRIAAPPAGATNEPGLDLMKAAERYHRLLELGESMGIVAQVEIWGSSKNLHRPAQAAFVALESGHSNACVLLDVYHIFRGGSDFYSLNLLSHQALQVFHMNDYPADPPRESLTDAHRVYPGDGIAPFEQILPSLASTGEGKILSLELFNREYWKNDALDIAKTGLSKMKQVVYKSLNL